MRNRSSGWFGYELWGSDVDGLLQLVRQRVHERVEVLHAVEGRHPQALELADQLQVVGRAGALDGAEQFPRRHVAVVEHVARRPPKPSPNASTASWWWGSDK